MPTRSTMRPALTPRNIGSAEKSDISTPTVSGEAPSLSAKSEMLSRLPLNAACAKTVATTSGASGTSAAPRLERRDALLDRRMAREHAQEAAAFGNAVRLERLRQRARLHPAEAA